MSNRKKYRRPVWFYSVLLAAALIAGSAVFSEGVTRPLRYYTDANTTAMTYYTNAAGDGNISLWGINTDNPLCELDINGSICVNRTGFYYNGVNVSGGGAPATASYVTLGLDGTLTSERVLTAGKGITTTDTGAGGTITINVTGLEDCTGTNASQYNGSEWNCLAVGSGSGSGNVTSNNGTNGYWGRFTNSTNIEAASLSCASGYGISTLSNNSVCTQFVQPTRSVFTTAPITGGGTLAGDLTIAMAAASAVADGYLTAPYFVLFNGYYANISNINSTLQTNINGVATNLTSVNTSVASNTANIATLNSTKAQTGTASCSAGTYAQNITLNSGGAPTFQCYTDQSSTVNVTINGSGILYSFTTEANNSGTAETTLYNYTVPSGVLAGTGEVIAFDFAGVTSGCTGTVSCRFRLYINQTLVYDSTAVALSGDGAWSVVGYVQRASASTGLSTVRLGSSGASTWNYNNETAVSNTAWSAGNVSINFTATSSGVGAGSNQISGKQGYVKKDGATGTGNVTGNGTTNKLVKWTSSSTVNGALLSDDGTRTNASNTDLAGMKVASFSSVYSNGNSTGNKVIDWNNGAVQNLTLNNTAVNVSFTSPTAGVSRLTLFLSQDSTGSRVPTFVNSTFKWPAAAAPTFTTTANRTDIITCVYDGVNSTANYWCVASLNFG